MRSEGPLVVAAPDLPLPDAAYAGGKTLLLDSDDAQILPKKFEAIAVMSPTEIIVFSDSDFGIEGDRTEIRRVTFATPVLQ